MIKYSIIGFEDVVKMRCATMSLECVSQTGRLLLIPAQDIFALFKSDCLLKKEMNRIINRTDFEKHQTNSKRVHQWDRLAISPNKIGTSIDTLIKSPFSPRYKIDKSDDDLS